MGLEMVVTPLTILVTGANGFIGQHLCALLTAQGHTVRRAVRKSDGQPNTFATDRINGNTDWREAVKGADAVVHLAARVHVLRERDDVPLARFRRTNVEATRNLALQAAAEGVKRFVFLSTIGVHGVKTEGRGFREDDPLLPVNDYAFSKVEAELVMRDITLETGMETVILRPPLVYGPGVKANFLKLMQAVEKGIPLPLGSIRNKRDMLYVGNLADAISRSITHPNAAGETFLVADGHAVSTPELIRGVGAYICRPARLLPLPPRMLSLIGRILGKCDTVYRLTGSLEVDITKIKQTLDWQPPYAFDEGLKATAEWYRSRE